MKNNELLKKYAGISTRIRRIFAYHYDQAEEMITQYTCYYNAIKRWESNHKETEILH